MTNTEELREKLYSLLGDLPARDRPIQATVVRTEETPDYVLEHLVLDLNGLEAVPAVFVKPLGCTGPCPAILYNHWHGGQYWLGKWELPQGHSEYPLPSYAMDLTAQGYGALCIDAWNFGERRGRTETELFKTMLWQGQVLWGMMVYDSIRALDYLSTRSDVDSKRIATMGMSMGSTMSWWLAALDTRVKVCVDICCLTDFAALLETRGIDGHGVYYFVPSLLKHFDTGSINALIAPRPHLSVAGEYDGLTPKKGLDRLDAFLHEVYAQAGIPEAWSLQRYPVGHVETVAMRAEILRFLAEWL